MGNGLNGVQTGEAAAAPPQTEVAAVPIRPASGIAVPSHAQPSAGGECLRPYINDQLNSRLPERLAGGAWSVRWQTDLDPGFPPVFVLQSSDRIVVQAAGRWTMFDVNKNPIHSDNFGPSDIVIDPPNSVFYLADRYGVLVGHKLADGSLAFSLPFSGGIEWQRQFFARRGQEFAAVSYQRAIQPHSAADPNAVTIEAQELGSPMTVQDDAVTSAQRTGDFFFASPRAFAAGLGPGIVVAIRNEILVTEFGRKIRGRYSDTFAPGPISLDETARVYALVNRGEHQSLWSLTPRGERVFALDFGPENPLKPGPPVIGYDHRIFLTTGDSVLCVSPEGKLLWRQPAGGAVAGMAVTTDDELIVSAGSTLWAFDRSGTRRVLYDFKGDTLLTPAASLRGGLLVASARKLYRLEAK
jgi:hypothetical protein